MNWPMKPLSELCLLAVDCVNKTAPVLDDPTPYKMIRTTNVKRGFIDTETVRYVSEATFEKWTRRSKPQYGDVILTREAPVGEVGRCTFDDSNQIFLGQRLFQYRANPELLDWNYLAYALQSPLVQNKLHGVSFGATVPHIKVGEAENLQIPYPPLETQRAIGGTLAAYDDLIEANSRSISLLEESARILYSEWFVNLRFPGYEHLIFIDSEFGKIPSGWNVVRLDEVCFRITDGAHTSPPSTDLGYPMASVKDMHDYGIDVSTCRQISEADFNALVNADCKVLKGDVLVAKDGSYLKHVFANDKDADIVLLSSIAILRPHENIPSSFLVYTLKSSEVSSRMKQCVSGVAIPRIVLKDFRKFKILLPCAELLMAWSEHVDHIVKLCCTLVEQNQRLADARNELLPKLMSGAIQV